MVQLTKMLSPQALSGQVRIASTERERRTVLDFQTKVYCRMGLLPSHDSGSHYRDRWVDDSVYFFMEDDLGEVMASCRLTMPEHLGSPFFAYGELHPQHKISMKKRPLNHLCEIGALALPRGRRAIPAFAHLVRAAFHYSVNCGRYDWVAMVNEPTHSLLTSRFGAELKPLGDWQAMRPSDVDVAHWSQPVEFDLLHYIATGRNPSNATHKFITSGIVVDLREQVNVS